MKLSKYNHLYTPNGEEAVLINYLNGQIHIFRGQANDKIYKFFRDGEKNQNVESFLAEKGYLVDDGYNEDSIVAEIEERIYEQTDMLSLIIILTENCNLRCIYCCEEHIQNRIQLELQEKIIEFVKKNIKKYKILKVEWFGGEPLLCMDIIEKMSKAFISICEQNLVQYFAVTSTNGYLLNCKTMERLKKNHLYAYQITVDGLQKTHDKQRMCKDGSGSWEVIINNLKDIRNNLKSNMISILIRTNITHPIYENIEEYMLFLQKEFGNDKRFNFTWKLAEDWGRIEENDKKILCGVKEYSNVIKLASDYRLRNRYLAGTLRPGARVCEASKKNSFIFFPSGIVGKCERNVEPEKSHIANIDDLLQDPEKYLNITLTKKRLRPEMCHTCEKLPICLGKACPFLTDIQCGYEMIDIDLILHCILKCDDTCKVIYHI